MDSIFTLQEVLLKNGTKLFGPFTFQIRLGEHIAILGPSGAGKSTLLKLLARDLRRLSGSIKLNGIDLYLWSLHDLSQYRAVLPQSTDVAFGLIVELVIRLGRISRPMDISAQEITLNAAKLARCDHLLRQSFDTLSGGEKARVQLARIFAQMWDQQDGLILVDEPLASLDPGLQIELLERMRQFALDRNHAILAVLHDMNQAIQNFDRLLLIKAGKLIGDLPPGPQAVFALEHLYDIQLDVVCSRSGSDLVFPRARSVQHIKACSSI